MTHYVCSGSCQGIASEPGSCQAEMCEKKGEALEMCECEEAKHQAMPPSEGGEEMPKEEGDES